MRRLIAALVWLFPSLAVAHGGLPISEGIVFRGDVLVVPTKFWGVFFGRDGGPWRWICEEAIDEYLYGVALSADGQTLYTVGHGRPPPPPDGGTPDGGAPPETLTLHRSTDGGTTWSAAPLAYRFDGSVPWDVEPLAVDPADSTV